MGNELEEQCADAFAVAVLGQQPLDVDNDFRRWIVGELAPLVAHEWLTRKWEWLGFEFPARDRWFAASVEEALERRGGPATTLVDLTVVLGSVPSCR